MIIVSQDKDTIVNFNNVDSIDIVADLDGTGKVPYKIYYETSTTREELGIYDAEERAKQVLKEIRTAYACSEMIKIPYVTPIETIPGLELMDAFIYEMPED